MPNHVHILVKTYEDFPVSKIVHSWKSYSSKMILNSLNNRASFKDNVVWQKEYWDRFIRNDEHYKKAIEYIHNNPVKAGLVRNAVDWPWSNAGEPPALPGK